MPGVQPQTLLRRRGVAEVVITAVQKQYPGRFVVRNFYLEKEGALFRRYKVAIVPSQVFLDPSGKEVYQHAGPFKPAELIKKLRELKFIR